MKVRHLPAVLGAYPLFVLRHGPAILAHTFRGSTWQSLLGLETDRQVFLRYKALRAAEREYLPAEGSRESDLDRLTLAGPEKI